MILRRKALVTLAAVLLGTAATGVASVRPAAAVSCEGGITSSALNNMIRGARLGPGGMAGMDYAHVHQLPDGRVL